MKIDAIEVARTVCLDLSHQVEKLRAENRALREALEAVEWIKEDCTDSQSKRFCPFCGNFIVKRHSASCKVGNALKQARGER